MSVMRIGGWAAFAVALLFGGACGNGAAETSTPGATATPPTTTTSTPGDAMSTAEQTFEAGSVSLSVPAGAVPAGVEITLVETALPEHLEFFAIPETAVTAEPSELVFEEPATLVWRLRLDEVTEGGASIPLILPLIVGADKDEFLDNVVLSADGDELVISAELTHFSTIYVAGLAEVEDCSFLFGWPAVRVVGVAETFTVTFSPEGDRSACRLNQLVWGESGPLTRLRGDPTLIQEYLCTAEGNGTYTMDFELSPRHTRAIEINNLPPRRHILVTPWGEPVRPAKPPPERTSVHFQVVASVVCVPPPAPPIEVSMITGAAVPGRVWRVSETGNQLVGDNGQDGPVDFVILFRTGDSDEPVTAWISFWDTQQGAVELFQQSAEPRHGGCGREGHPETEFLPGPIAVPVVGPDGHLWCRAFFQPDEQASLFRYEGEATDNGNLVSDWNALVDGGASMTAIEPAEGRLWLDIRGRLIEVPPEVYDDLSP